MLQGVSIDQSGRQMALDATSDGDTMQITGSANKSETSVYLMQASDDRCNTLRVARPGRSIPT